MSQTLLPPPAGRWIPYRFGHEASLPGLTNHLGSLQAEADPVAVKHVVFPPLSAAEETTGMTTLDGVLLAASGRPVEMRWSLGRLERRCVVGGWRLDSETIAVDGAPAVIVALTIRNPGRRRRCADLRLRFSGRGRNTGGEGYLWAVPAVATTVATLNRNEGLAVSERHDPRRHAVAFAATAEPCCSLQGVSGLRRGEASWADGRLRLSLAVAAGASRTIHVVLAWGRDAASATSLYDRLAAAPRAALAANRRVWTAAWRTTRADLLRSLGSRRGEVARLQTGQRAMLGNAMATALYLRRDYPSRVEGLYLTLFPRHGEGSFYLWDVGMAAPFLARLDAPALRGMAEAAASSIDIYAQQSMNAFTGAGGGWHYAANAWSLFRLAWSYIAASGDRAWLKKRLSGIRQGQTVLAMLEELALAWTTATPGREPLTTRSRTRTARSRPAQSDGGSAPFAVSVEMPVDVGGGYPFAVADVGDRGTLLEGTTSYAHQVASMNAGYVWMMRRLADLHDHAGDAPRAIELRRLAHGLSAEILCMYRPADGFFASGQPGGSVHPSRVSLDHLMVMTCMPEDLGPQVRKGLVASFRRELQTPGWMRCVSPAEPDVTSGIRVDVTFVGCYAGWVALMAEGLCRIGQAGLAGDWLERMAAVTAQGPFGQAYWAENQMPPVHGGAAKSTDEMPQGTHWAEMGGVAFGATIIAGLLGIELAPPATRERLGIGRDGRSP
jgi:hypothetical protein